MAVSRLPLPASCCPLGDFFPASCCLLPAGWTPLCGNRASCWVQEEGKAVGRCLRGNPLDGDIRKPSRHGRAGDRQGLRDDALAGHRVDQGALGRGPEGVGQLGPAVLGLNRAPVGMLKRLLVDRRHVGAAGAARNRS